MPFSCLSDFITGREVQLIHHADTAVFKGGFHRDFAILLDGAERRAEAVKAGNGMLIRAERIHACAVGRQQTRTSAVQNRLYTEQNLVRAVRVTADVLIFGIAEPMAVNVLTDLIERILIGLCQLFALKVV